jgi:hypothetical protein
MSASLDVKSHGWKPRFKVLLIVATFEGMDTIVFTKNGVCLEDPESRLVFCVSSGEREYTTYFSFSQWYLLYIEASLPAHANGTCLHK